MLTAQPCKLAAAAACSAAVHAADHAAAWLGIAVPGLQLGQALGNKVGTVKVGKQPCFPGLWVLPALAAYALFMRRVAVVSAAPLATHTTHAPIHAHNSTHKTACIDVALIHTRLNFVGSVCAFAAGATAMHQARVPPRSLAAWLSLRPQLPPSLWRLPHGVQQRQGCGRWQHWRWLTGRCGATSSPHQHGRCSACGCCCWSVNCAS